MAPELLKQQEGKFPCHLCDFVSSLPNGNGVLASSIGKKRSSNQDRVAYAEIAQKNDFFIVYVLADGIGGGKAGDLCASRAITEFLAELSAVNSKESTEKKLSSILKKVNKRIPQILLKLNSSQFQFLMGLQILS